MKIYGSEDYGHEQIGMKTIKVYEGAAKLLLLLLYSSHMMMVGVLILAVSIPVILAVKLGTWLFVELGKKRWPDVIMTTSLPSGLILRKIWTPNPIFVNASVV